MEHRTKKRTFFHSFGEKNGPYLEIVMLRGDFAWVPDNSCDLVIVVQGLRNQAESGASSRSQHSKPHSAKYSLIVDLSDTRSGSLKPELVPGFLFKSDLAVVNSSAKRGSCQREPLEISFLADTVKDFCLKAKWSANNQKLCPLAYLVTQGTHFLFVLSCFARVAPETKIARMSWPFFECSIVRKVLNTSSRLKLSLTKSYLAKPTLASMNPNRLFLCVDECLAP